MPLVGPEWVETQCAKVFLYLGTSTYFTYRLLDACSLGGEYVCEIIFT